MIETRIEAVKPADPAAVDRVAKACGEVAIGCTDAGGLVDRVATSISSQSAILDELQAVMASLETDQRQVTDATDEARMLAENARARLTEGGRTISAAVGEFGEVAALGEVLGDDLGEDVGLKVGG